MSYLRRDISGWQVCFPTSPSLHTWCTPQCLFYGCSYENGHQGQAFFRLRHQESFCKFFPPPWVVQNEVSFRATSLTDLHTRLPLSSLEQKKAPGGSLLVAPRYSGKLMQLESGMLYYAVLSCSVMSDSLQPHELKSTRLLCP